MEPTTIRENTIFNVGYTRRLLLCPVRGCRLALNRDQTRFACANQHSFDIARSGYINLLQPQDRRSRRPGDTAAAVVARRRLHDRGVTEPLLRCIAGLAALSGNDTVLDAGCGDGYFLGNLTRESGARGCGIDISVTAIDAAARRYADCEWVVANADRLVPYADKAFSVILSITGRMNAAEFRRVLSDDGRLLVAIPAPDDLIELRGAGRDRVPRTIAEFETSFDLVENRCATTTTRLDAAAVEDVLLSIYRPLRARPAAAMELTFSFDLLLFRCRKSAGL